MKHIVEWLIQIEDWASRIYENLAPGFKDDAHFHNFLVHLADDEALHFHFMSSALICLEKNPHLASDIVLDQPTRELVEAPLQKIETAVQSGDIGRPQLMELIYQNEHSEWNDLFLYVVNTLEQNCPRFKVIGPSLQNHLRQIERFMHSNPDGSGIISKIKKLSPVWKERVLVVDDSEPIVELLSSLLSRMGGVETARNGAEAYQKASRDYYPVIISDVDMPVMNGIEFYKKMKRTHPDIGSRFIFVSGDPTPEIRAYMEKESLFFVAKPFKLTEIRQAVHNIIDQITL